MTEEERYPEKRFYSRITPGPGQGKSRRPCNRGCPRSKKGKGHKTPDEKKKGILGEVEERGETDLFSLNGVCHLKRAGRLEKLIRGGPAERRKGARPLRESRA